MNSSTRSNGVYCWCVHSKHLQHFLFLQLLAHGYSRVPHISWGTTLFLLSLSSVQYFRWRTNTAYGCIGGKILSAVSKNCKTGWQRSMLEYSKFNSILCISQMHINFCFLEGNHHLAVSLDQALVSMDLNWDFEWLNLMVSSNSVSKFRG